MTTPGEFVKVGAVAAADVEDGIITAQARKVQRLFGQVDRRPLISVD
jgi:hypothetical protein